jgi:ATP adenylyltransferase
MQTLYTPWRFEYISVSPSSESCFFCEAATDPEDPERLVVFSTQHHLVLLNRYPYTNGHLMVAPLAHLANPADGEPETVREFWPLVLRAQRALEQAYRPHGFNMGINLGRGGGAGVPGHFHFHVVPRWEGDTNFMSVVGGVRLVPEEPRQIRDRLRPIFAAESD